MEKETATPSSNKLVKVVIGLWAGIGLGVVLIGILIWTGVIPLLGAPAAADASEQGPALAQLESGTLAPDETMTHLDGSAMTLADYRGKVVVMNFWATWCGPCVEEMPMFQEYQDQYPQMVMLGVDLEETPEKVNAFIEQLRLTYTIVLDQKGDMGRTLRVSFLPTTIFIDEKGEIRFRHYGIMTPEQMDYYLETLGVASE